MKIKSFLKKIVNLILEPFDFCITPKANLVDFYLHEYKSYEEYRDVQIKWNKEKINAIWADEKTLDRIFEIVYSEFCKLEEINGICHGTRNGFEQNYLRSLSKKIHAIGTDISETATNYENSVQWDFHDVNDQWKNSQDFIYTNSLDQSWQPKIAIQTWLSQLKDNGILLIEHTIGHGPEAAGEMDPFGVRPTVMPYILSMWFGSQISIEHSVDKKLNIDTDAWIFVIRKNVPIVVAK